MAFIHSDIQDVINRSRIRTAADNIKSTDYGDDPMLDAFVEAVVQMADDYTRKYSARTRGGWSN
jgi:hypothetical protein